MAVRLNATACALAAGFLLGAALPAQAGLLVPDCGEDRAALEELVSGLPASCEQDSDCGCYDYLLFPDAGPVALRSPGVPAELRARLEDAQARVRRACGAELDAARGAAPRGSYVARCDSGRCVRVKAGARPRAGGGFWSSVALGFRAVAGGIVKYSPLILLLAAAVPVFLKLRRFTAKAPPPSAGQTAPGPRPPEPRPRTGLGIFFSIALRLILALGVLLALLLFGVSRKFGPKDFSAMEIGEFCAPAYAAAGFELNYSDTIEKGGKTDQWMDSAAFCRLRTTPERARAFKEKLSAGHVPDPAEPPQYRERDIFSCEFYNNKKRPKWWQGGDRPGAACYNFRESQTHPRGVDLVIFEEEGLIFAERWRT